VVEVPAASLMGAGYSMPKQWLAGSVYVTRCVYAVTLRTVSTFMYSPPTAHLRHTSASAHSMPNMCARSAFVITSMVG